MTPWADELLIVLTERGSLRRDYVGLVWLLMDRYPGRPRPRVGEVVSCIRWLRLTGQIRFTRRHGVLSIVPPSNNVLEHHR
jgi:hypothetical protein